jgi:hypothetical protein
VSDTWDPDNICIGGDRVETWFTRISFMRL